MKKTILFATVLAATLLSGCATDQMKKDIADAKSAAAAAQQSADAAAATADAADSKADRALSAAQEAQACCDANSEKIDRMFHKAMMK
jgi:outer membrane murein-binding lipoprotein Lpp